MDAVARYAQEDTVDSILIFDEQTPVAFIAGTNPGHKENAFRSGVGAPQLVEACGLIPYLATNDYQGTFKETLERNYDFGVSWQTGANIGKELDFEYPEDEPMPALVRLSTIDQSDEMLIFGNGIVALEHEGKWHYAHIS